MLKLTKITRSTFCKKFKFARRLRRSDRIQFELLFNQYKREKLGHI